MAKRFYRSRYKHRFSQNSRKKPYTQLFTDALQEHLNQYIFGNFHSYYGYRNQGTADPRLTCMKKEWLTGKDVLDVGCNAGHFTLFLARNFSPRVVVGIDIDGYLVRCAKKNTIYYLDDDDNCDSSFPISCVALYGPFAKGVIPEEDNSDVKFPYNVNFVKANYVLDSDELLAMQKPEFDTILCLSVTKWIHLNWGDEGLKRTFHRMFAHLRPGGFLILEAQPYSSYRRKKKLADYVYENFLNIKLYPEDFNDYLLKEVGFKSCELIDTPAHSSKGFCRPIYLFTKGCDVKEDATMPKDNIVHDESSSNSTDLSNYEELSD